MLYELDTGRSELAHHGTGITLSFLERASPDIARPVLSRISIKANLSLSINEHS
jgi:hypothetical protein